MPEILTLRERRFNEAKKLRAIHDLAEREERDLTDEEETQFKELRTLLDVLDKRIHRAEYMVEQERTMEIDSNQPRRGNDGSPGQLFSRASVVDAINCQFDQTVDAGIVREINQEVERRTGRKASGIWVPHTIFEQRAVLTSGSGGNLYPETHRGDLMIDTLRERLQVQALGATILNGLVGDQDIPRLTGNATAYWVAEHGAVTGSDHTFDTVALSPTTLGAEVEYSRRMLLNAAPAVEQLVRNDLAQVLATEIDNQAINGDGTSNKPTGILNVSGIGDTSHGTDGGAATWDSILSIIDELAVDSALIGSLGFLTSPAVVKKLRQTVVVTSTDSRMIQSEPGNLAGYSLRQSNHVPDNLTKGSGTDLSALIFGNWSDLLIGYWSAVDILVNPYHTDVYSKGGVKINALQDVDIAVRHPESFSAALDIDPS